MQKKSEGMQKWNYRCLLNQNLTYDSESFVEDTSDHPTGIPSLNCYWHRHLKTKAILTRTMIPVTLNCNVTQLLSIWKTDQYSLDPMCSQSFKCKLHITSRTLPAAFTIIMSRNTYPFRAGVFGAIRFRGLVWNPFCSGRSKENQLMS